MADENKGVVVSSWRDGFITRKIVRDRDGYWLDHGTGTIEMTAISHIVARRLLALQGDSDELAKIEEGLRTQAEQQMGPFTGNLMGRLDAHVSRMDIHSTQLAQLRAAVAAIEAKIADGWLNAFQAGEIGKITGRIADLLGRVDAQTKIGGLLRDECGALRSRLDALEPAVGQIGIEVQRLEDGKVLERLDKLEEAAAAHEMEIAGLLDRLEGGVEHAVDPVIVQMLGKTIQQEAKELVAGVVEMLKADGDIGRLEADEHVEMVRLDDLEDAVIRYVETSGWPDVERPIAAEDADQMPIVRRAVRAERERCVGIVESIGGDNGITEKVVDAIVHNDPAPLITENADGRVRCAVQAERDRAIRLVTETVGDQHTAQELIQKLVYPGREGTTRIPVPRLAALRNAGRNSAPVESAPVTEQPDRYCVTTPDGDCVSTDSRCMHQPPVWTPILPLTGEHAGKWATGVIGWGPNGVPLQLTWMISKPLLEKTHGVRGSATVIVTPRPVDGNVYKVSFRGAHPDWTVEWVERGLDGGDDNSIGEEA